METESARRILNLVTNSFKNLADHAFQSEVNSPFLRQLMENISKIEQICKNELDSGFTVTPQRAKLHENDKNDILRIVYAMSRFDYPLICAITGKDYNQTQAFNYLERVTGVKSTTLRNMRDRFDPHVNQTRSKRKGWHQAELLPEYNKIINIYSDKDETFITKEIANILDTMKKRV